MMEQELIEKIKVVAVCDGWVKRDSQPINRKWLYTKNNNSKWLHFMDYHTNISTLYPIAKKVCEELREWCGKNGRSETVKNLLINVQVANNKFDASQLFEAVYYAIEFLNQNK